MLVLITYDVNTETSEGRKRLRRIAKKCVDYGQRVQYSVFECSLNPAQLRQLQDELCSIIDPEKDSLRIYQLGSISKANVQHYGVKAGYQADGLLMI